MSCSLSVVAHLGSGENVSMLNVSQGSRARILKESLEMLHVDFVSLMRSLSSFLICGTKTKGRHSRHMQCPGE